MAGPGLLHRQSYILATAAVCTLMGAGGFRDLEAVGSRSTTRQPKALGCRPDPHGRLRSPSDSTFRRVINACVVRTFVRIVSRWLLDPARPRSGPEAGYHATSLAPDERDPETMSRLIHDHGSAIGNGVRHRRDVSSQEDGCRVKDRVGAEMLVALRNLAIGLYELELDRGRTQAGSSRNWMKSQTFGNAHRMLRV